MNFSHYWQHTDSISHVLYLILIMMSVLSWTLLIWRLLATRRIKQQANRNLQQAIESIAYRVSALNPEQRKLATEQALLQAIARQTTAAEQGVAPLGTIASLAPFIGLFGTVWGIFHALVAVGQSGQAGLAQVATPVGEALIMTGLGLAVAIPAVLAYNLCVRQNRTLSHQLHDYAHSLMLDTLLQPYATQPALAQSTIPSH